MVITLYGANGQTYLGANGKTLFEFLLRRHDLKSRVLEITNRFSRIVMSGGFRAGVDYYSKLRSSNPRKTNYRIIRILFGFVFMSFIFLQNYIGYYEYHKMNYRLIRTDVWAYNPCIFLRLMRMPFAVSEVFCFCRF